MWTAFFVNFCFFFQLQILSYSVSQGTKVIYIYAVLFLRPTETLLLGKLQLKV